ncbi:gamma-mobile-trio protein GmtX [Methylophilus sp. Leaf414]|uniref:gamma-mobile-trio protein GmtX n=1 Tax=Methylophilus sp. Leaf414 TaxID=1736371 RepID=UPI0006FC2105|nr:gamma-mobile-trio protein GmtX [Methylophilus sp. Leaf414]KQT34144.1 hypothetical protein ASG24_10365 [Methylophilus sp. Leaf414]
MDSTQHPDSVLEALIAKGNRRDKEQKLRKLHELCAFEYNRHSQGARDLSLANISKLADSHGLFKARTIYNAQSSDYVVLISAWESYNGPKKVKQSTKINSKDDKKYAFLEKIEDPSVRSLCQIALIERDKLKAELNLLKSQTQVVVDMRPLGAEIVKGAANVAVIETAAQLTESERIALAEAVDPKNLELRKWSLGHTGEIMDDKGRFIFKPGFATAIRNILKQN